jgi:MFS family permease
MLPTALQELTPDAWLLFAMRFVRLFAYGSLSVVLVFYLVGVGLSQPQIGMLLTLTLAGDTLISLFLTTRADRIGRRRTLVVGALLMAAAGLVFASTRDFSLLVVAGTIGVISPSGNEVGPFLSIEQAAPHTRGRSEENRAVCLHVADHRHARRWLAAPPHALPANGIYDPGWRHGFSRSPRGRRDGDAREEGVERLPPASAGLVAGCRGEASALFALTRWRRLRPPEPRRNGSFPIRRRPRRRAIFFWANILAGISALMASRLLRASASSRPWSPRTCLQTSCFLVPLMPTLPLAVLVLLVRFSISQMDVPTRQSYVMAVVSPDERSAAAGITGVARTIGAAISPLFVGFMFARPALINLPFFIAGGLKIAYDLLLYREFVAVQPPEETQR